MVGLASSLLGYRWESLKAQAAGRRGALEEALERAKNFNDHWKALIDWLTDAERRAYADWKPCALPETCQAEITKHQVRQWHKVIKEVCCMNAYTVCSQELTCTKSWRLRVVVLLMCLMFRCDVAH